MVFFFVFFCSYCSAETEAKDYREVAAEKGVSLDDSDEEWGKDSEQNWVTKEQH